MICITICTDTQYTDIHGIHLNHPDEWYLKEALRRAMIENFKTIFCHYQRIGVANYSIPYDVANRLMVLSKEKGFRISFTHPVA